MAAAPCYVRLICRRSRAGCWPPILIRNLTGNLPLPGIFPDGIGPPHGLVGYY